MMPISKENVQFLIKNEILPGVTWEDPTSGYNATGPVIRERVDQLLSRVPFRSTKAPGLDIPRIESVNSDHFLDSTLAATTLSLSLEEADVLMVTESYEMGSMGATLRIPSASLGRELEDFELAEFQNILRQLLKRYLSIALVYGAYSSNTWTYPGTWDQSKAANGMQVLCTNNDGYVHTSSSVLSTLTLADLNNFVHSFKGANQGRIDYLVMNMELREKYLNLWHGSAQVPQYIEDPMTGKMCLAHDGIPILVNDYILTYQATAETDHPENYRKEAPDTKQTSMYAVVLGEDRQGMFGIHPESFGSQPIRVEQARTAEDEDTILLRGSVEAGVAVKTTRSIGRWAGIDMS